MNPIIIGQKYDKVADWWHEKHCDSEYGMQQIRRAISYCNNKKLALDVGCGAGGRVINELEKQGFEVHGIDVSKRMIALAKENHPNFKCTYGDITQWTSDQSYDLIIAWDSIFHLSMANQKPAIDNMCSLLKQEGILIYTFGDAIGDKEDKSFDDGKGGQYGQLENDVFGYGSIGIAQNLQRLMENHCKVMHLELDQYPEKHVYIIGKKQ